MKTIADLNNKVKSNQSFIERHLNFITNSELKKLRKENQFIKSMILYLESNPSEEYLKNELSRLSLIVKSKLEQFEYWKQNICAKNIEEKKMKTVFKQELGLTDIEKRIKTLKYLIE